MRWLFIIVLVLLVGCVLSIVFMNGERMPLTSGNQPGPSNPLTPPPTNP